MTHTNQSKVSLVIPVYNEEQNLKELNKRILAVFDSMDTDYEIIYVDDGSSDKSLDIIKQFCNGSEFIHFISFYRNFGQHAGVLAGLKHARGDIIMTLDADLQNPPEEIPKFVDEMNNGYDIVAGRRIERQDDIRRKIPSYFVNKFISKLTGVKFNDYGCMMRAYNRNIVKQLVNYGEKSLYITAFGSWLSDNSKEIPIKHEPRFMGKTKYSLFKLFRQLFDLITAYTIVPIQIIGIIGLIFFGLGIVLFIYLMYFRVFVGHINPLTSFIALLILFSGLILFSIGVISEYIVRIYKEVKKMPLYLIRNSSIQSINDE